MSCFFKWLLCVVLSELSRNYYSIALKFSAAQLKWTLIKTLSAFFLIIYRSVGMCILLGCDWTITLGATDFPVDTGLELNVHKTFRRRPGRFLNVLCTFNLRPVSTGLLISQKPQKSRKKGDTVLKILVIWIYWTDNCTEKLRER